MDLINQKDQAHLILADSKYAPSKPCTVCGMPTRMGVTKCMHCLQLAYLIEELVYTRDWLRDHPAQLLVVGHDQHKIAHLALIRKALLDVGWCGGKVSQKREKRQRVARHEFPAAVPEKLCVHCLEAWGQMGLAS